MADKFFWYDLMTTDTEAARKFYADVIGWGAQDSGAPGMDYTVLTVQERGVAGLMALPDELRKAGHPPSWTGYVAVEDVDRSAQRLAELGGTVHRPPTDVPGIIRFAVVADPQGAGFVLAKPLVDNPAPPPPPGTPGTVGWHELYATDATAAFAFYEKMFGWTKAEAIDMGPMGIYQLFASGDTTVGGMMNKPAVVPVPGWGFYFNVAAIDAAAARVVAGKGTVLNGPHQVPGGQWIVQCKDPQGAVFALVSRQK